MTDEIRTTIPTSGSNERTAAPLGAAQEIGTHVIPSAPLVGSGDFCDAEALSPATDELIAATRDVIRTIRSRDREIELLARFIDLKVHRDDMPESIREIVEREVEID